MDDMCQLDGVLQGPTGAPLEAGIVLLAVQVRRGIAVHETTEIFDEHVPTVPTTALANFVRVPVADRRAKRGRSDRSCVLVPSWMRHVLPRVVPPRVVQVGEDEG
jgi:hypothetical protein